MEMRRGGSGLSRVLSDVVTALETSLMRVSLVSSPPARLFASSTSSAPTHARTYTHIRVYSSRISHIHAGERATPATGFHWTPNKHALTDDNGKPIFIAFREPPHICVLARPFRFHFNTFRATESGIFKLFESRWNSGEAAVRVQPTECTGRRSLSFRTECIGHR